jgi:hypothetical protein
VAKNDVYGNARIVTFFVVVFSMGVFMFTWMVPNDMKRTHTLIAIMFVFNLNMYFLSPLLTILKNENLRKFAAKNIRPNFMDKLYPNKVSPA